MQKVPQAAISMAKGLLMENPNATVSELMRRCQVSLNDALKIRSYYMHERGKACGLNRILAWGPQNDEEEAIADLHIRNEMKRIRQENDEREAKYMQPYQRGFVIKDESHLHDDANTDTWWGWVETEKV